MSRNKEHRPNGAAAEAGASVFLVSAHLFSYVTNIYAYSLYIPFTFHIYSLNMFHIFSLVRILEIMNLLSKTFDFVKRS